MGLFQVRNRGRNVKQAYPTWQKPVISVMAHQRLSSAGKARIVVSNGSPGFDVGLDEAMHGGSPALMTTVTELSICWDHS